MRQQDVSRPTLIRTLGSLTPLRTVAQLQRDEKEADDSGKGQRAPLEC